MVGRHWHSDQALAKAIPKAAASAGSGTVMRPYRTTCWSHLLETFCSSAFIFPVNSTTNISANKRLAATAGSSSTSKIFRSGIQMRRKPQKIPAATDRQADAIQIRNRGGRKIIAPTSASVTQCFQLMTPNVELTGAARLYRAASRERSERG